MFQFPPCCPCLLIVEIMDQQFPLVVGPSSRVHHGHLHIVVAVPYIPQPPNECVLSSQCDAGHSMPWGWWLSALHQTAWTTGAPATSSRLSQSHSLPAFPPTYSVFLIIWKTCLVKIKYLFDISSHLEDMPCQENSFIGQGFSRNASSSSMKRAGGDLD